MGVAVPSCRASLSEQGGAPRPAPGGSPRRPAAPPPSPPGPVPPLPPSGTTPQGRRRTESRSTAGRSSGRTPPSRCSRGWASAGSPAGHPPRRPRGPPPPPPPPPRRDGAPPHPQEPPVPYPHRPLVHEPLPVDRVEELLHIR